ncbi:DUF3114 domain-containing protein [Streptococcus dentapri]|uniref:DUF3114 domain-containing protein n=1 Tax=Streptococcus dentapri TaxID=573564 RepID=A0ABV8D194_9STRE
MVKIGSAEFQENWNQLKREKSPKKGLQFILDHLDFPDDLSGELIDNQALVARFSDNLAPHDRFWVELSGLIRRQMKGTQFEEETIFNRQLHQLRYVISSQQAQYVRSFYRKPGMTDQAALIAYMKANKLRPNIFDNARLHNKRSFKETLGLFPDDEESYNIKVLLGVHTEFIIDGFGRFLNEIDAETVTTNGIVNGASFNYGNTPWSHVRLDVKPVSHHDPTFRRAVAKPFKSPNQAGKVRLARFWQERKSSEFGRSLYNKKGGYAKNGRSLSTLIASRKKDFKKEWKQG